MRIRITPACAGKRVCIPMRSCGRGDHPRVCGEKGLHPHALLWAGGSPPRVRGKAPPWTTRGFRCRITPACAGKSTQRNQVTSHQKDHPRVCGEKGINTLIGGANKGSPPRVRGKAYTWSKEELKKRITPACAGKSLYLYRGGSVAQDHPRVCGEKTKKSP